MRVLFIAEAVTMAHVVRPLALAEGLRNRGIAVQLAIAGSGRDWPTDVDVLRLPGIGAEAFSRALERGRPVLESAVLNELVKADLALLGRCRPDLVIGDFRLSLSISARVARVTYATLTNAYWSPSYRRPLPMPVLPHTRVLPLQLAQALFDLGQRFVLPRHCAPMNEVRASHGLPSLGNDLKQVYTDADHVLLADLPGMFQLESAPVNQHHLGPVLWSPPVDPPAWWNDVPRDRPIVYLTLGSSGSRQVFANLARMLAIEDLTVIASSAGGAGTAGIDASRCLVAPYLPGDRAAAMADLVICNGGSMSCQQAFIAGRPVLGVASNMDQFLNMQGVSAAGAGLCLRADRLSASAVRQACRSLLNEPGFTESARRLGQAMASHDAAQTLHELLPTLVRLA